MTAAHLPVTRSEEPGLFAIRILLWLEFSFQFGEAVGMLSCWQCIEPDNVQGSPGTKNKQFLVARPQSAPCATFCYPAFDMFAFGVGQIGIADPIIAVCAIRVCVYV